MLVQCKVQNNLERPHFVKVKAVEEKYFGKKISDPYRYMDDIKSPEVKNWLESKASYLRSALNNIPYRQSLIDNMCEFDKRKPSK